LKKYPIKKAKNSYLYDLKSQKYYDFRNNSNILGYSYKRLTNHVKNDISGNWNIKSNTVSHLRILKLFEKLFGNEYTVRSCFSIEEFFSRIFLNFKDNYSFKVIGVNFHSWLEKRNILPCNNSSKNEVSIIDMNDIFINFNGDINGFKDHVRKIKKNGILIFNYYWFPYSDIETSDADVVILPEIFSGNFNYLNILIRNKLNEFINAVNSIEDIPSLYLSSSLKNYFLIKHLMLNNEVLRLNEKKFKQSGRLFVLNDADTEKISLEFEKKNILINSIPPFYNYLPILLEVNQRKYLRKVL
jgi:hypothetical protein